jgi:hypothetical protein
MEAVPNLLKGEDLDAIRRELKVAAATQSQWREVCLASGIADLQRRDADGRDQKIAALEKALAETALDLSIARAINTVYERKATPGKNNRFPV